MSSSLFTSFMCICASLFSLAWCGGWDAKQQPGSPHPPCNPTSSRFIPALETFEEQLLKSVMDVVGAVNELPGLKVRGTRPGWDLPHGLHTWASLAGALAEPFNRAPFQRRGLPMPCHPIINPLRVKKKKKTTHAAPMMQRCQ